MSLLRPDVLTFRRWAGDVMTQHVEVGGRGGRRGRRCRHIESELGTHRLLPPPTPKQHVRDLR
ncbi:hypothetical protein chiPu_0027249, partial [Chiloscyllium punctatum]|nr:hypothetical protein [Chiloscyllium punctatum]